MRNTYAVINIGTLKTKSLVAYFDENNGIVPVYNSNNLTCFGCAMYENKNQILEENLEATIKEVLRLKDIIKKHQCDEVKLFATHALRDAANREFVIKEIKEKTGFDTEVITAKDEGNLYFQAVMADFRPDKDYVVCDMGGGSIQILHGNRENLFNDYSFKTGAQFLHERFTKDPHSPESFTTREDIETMRSYLKEQYSAMKDNLNTPLIYGSSNIVDLCKVLKISLEPCRDSANHPYKTYSTHLNNFIDHIIHYPYIARENMYKFQEGYMWGVDKAFLNIITLAEKFNSPYIIPSNASIMEGFLYLMRKKDTKKGLS